MTEDNSAQNEDGLTYERSSLDDIEAVDQSPLRGRQLGGRSPPPRVEITGVDDEDGGYGWLVVAACFIGRALYSLLTSFGIFFVALRDDLNCSRVEAALVGSICYCFSQTMGPVASVLCSTIGHRKTCILGSLLSTSGFIISSFASGMAILYFSYGIMVGVGAAFQFLPFTIMPSFYFQKRQQVATGIALAGTGVGALVLPIIIQYSIEAFTWRGAMLITGGISLQGCVAGALLRPNLKLKSLARMRKTEKRHRGAKWFLNELKILKDWNLVIMCTMMAMIPNVTCTYNTFFPDRVISYGQTAEMAAILLAITGSCSTVSRIVSGLLVNVFKIDTNIFCGCDLILFSAPHYLLIMDQASFGVLVVVAVGYGVFHGGFSIMYILMTRRLFGLAYLNSAMGFLMLADGLGSLSGTPVQGYISDMFGGYAVSFAISGSLAILCALCNLLLYLRNRARGSANGIVID